MARIFIDYDKCIGCGLCEDACTVRLITMDTVEGNIAKPRRDRISSEKKIGNTVTYDVPGCANCRVCQITCPEEALAIEVDCTKPSCIYCSQNHKR